MCSLYVMKSGCINSGRFCCASVSITLLRQITLPDIQILQTTVDWKQCATLPVKLSGGATTVIDGNVYHRGGRTDGSDTHDDEYVVYCYDPSQQAWTTLPPLPVRRFGLGQVQGKLVAVGG